ncbi:hypothetical protein B0T22DRAFT_76639 [Podospora appendiculata]|uniref:Uncharacterized protein n=1 Tax=Podospora appendiculata TaxID=314037 RepID=A0AAE1CHB3_9PEZI|nr:hypothetical protein B0T22DRAFT_76639 [Podospora appendiculata]
MAQLSGLNLVSTNLRNSEQWAPVVEMLLLHSDRREWREARLETSDIALSVSQLSTPAGHHGSIHFILLSTADVRKPHILHRLEGLHQSNGGGNAAIIFLLDESISSRGESAMHFTKLQLEITTKFGIPILPLTSLEELPSVLQVYKTNLLSSETTEPLPLETAHDLLPYCSVGPLMSRQSTEVLSRDSMSLKELLMETQNIEEGRGNLRTALGPEDAERLINFWEHEVSMV